MRNSAGKSFKCSTDIVPNMKEKYMKKAFYFILF